MSYKVNSSSSEEDDIQISDSDDFEPAVDQSLINPMILAVKNRDKIPPQLIDFARQNKDLQMIANNLHQLLSVHGFVKYSYENRQDIELIIRTFIFEAMSTSDFNDEDFGQQNMPRNQKLQEEMFELQKELESNKLITKNAEKMRDDLKNENRELQDEIDTLYKDNALTVQKLNNLKKENENAMTELKNKNDKLSDKLREAMDQLKIKEYADQRNHTQFKELTSNAANANSKMIHMKEKMAAKNEKIEEMESQIHDLTVKNQTLEDDNEKIAVYLNATRSKLNESKRIITKFNSGQVSSLQKENEMLRNSFATITKQFEAQSSELIELRKSQMLATTIMHKQIEVIAQYDRTCDSLSSAKQQNYNLTNQYNQLKTQNIQRNEKFEKLEEVMKKIMSLTDAETPEDITIQILKMKEFGCLENQRLVTAFEDQLRFMANLVNSDILYGKNHQPLNEDAAFAEKLKIEMVRCRKFIEDNTAEQEVEIPEEDQEEFKLETGNREDFIILASQVMRNEVLRKHADQLKKDSETLFSIAKIYDYEDDPSALPDFLTSKNKQLQNFFEQVSSHMNGDLTEHPFEDIIEYIIFSNSVFDDIRTVIKFNGNLAEIPQQIQFLIRNAAKSQSRIQSRGVNVSDAEHEEEEEEHNAAVTSISEKIASQRATEILKEQISILKSDFDSESHKSQATIKQQQKKIAELQAAAKKLQNEKKKIAEQLTECVAKNDDLSKREATHSQTLAAVNSNYKDLEGQVSDLRQLNQDLHVEMETKMKNADERIDKILKEERDQHQVELQNIQQRFNANLERQKMATEKKNKRIKALKARLNEVLTSYESAFKKQKETIRILREKTDKCINKTEEIVSIKDESHLENMVKLAQSEKEELQAKVNHLNDQLTKVQTIRDTFWKSQLAMVEMNTNTNIKKEVDAIISKIAKIAKCEPTYDAVISVFEQRETRDFSSTLNNIDTGSLKQLEEWEKWSRQLFSNVNHGEVFSHSSKELRFILGEMVLSSISHHLLLSRLESLRQQKIILLTGKLCNRTDEPPEIRCLMICVVCITRMKRRAGQITPHLFQSSLTM